VIFFVCFIVSMLLTLGFIPPLIKLSPIIKLVDIPNERKVHHKLIPRIGGIAIVLGALIPLLIWLPQQDTQSSLFIGIVVLLIFGIWDDRADLDYRIKLFGQFLSTVIVVIGGDIRIVALPFINDIELPIVLSQVISIVALIGIINAVNLVDGLDGLAGGSTLVGFSLIAFLAYQAGDNGLALLCLSVVGALLGFLRFNTHPASIFMGDSGSQFLGFIAGIASLRLTQQADVGISPLFPLLLFAIPIFDTFIVIARRIAQGRSPFSPDRNHIHHRLLTAGLDHYETVVLIYVLQGLLALLGFYFRYHSDAQLLIVLSMVLVALFGALHWCDAHPNVLGRLLAPHIAATPSRHQFKNAVFIVGRYSLALLLCALLAQSAFFTAAHNSDLFILIIALTLLFLGASILYRRQHTLAWLERLGIYVLCSTAIFFYYHIPADHSAQKSIIFLLFLAIFSFVIIGFQFSRRHTFELSPLDYLVIFITLTLAFYPVTDPQTRNLTVSISFLIGLFYTMEYILNSHIFSAQQLRKGLGFTCILTLAAFHHLI
jgi:UDP-GlcNAc:undecaprenyl-phosphate/decaprenyl-phosphate GlcNAc-1-phosphate transferase